MVKINQNTTSSINELSKFQLSSSNKLASSKSYNTEDRLNPKDKLELNPNALPLEYNDDDSDLAAVTKYEYNQMLGSINEIEPGKYKKDGANYNVYVDSGGKKIVEITKGDTSEIHSLDKDGNIISDITKKERREVTTFLRNKDGSLTKSVSKENKSTVKPGETPKADTTTIDVLPDGSIKALKNGQAVEPLANNAQGLMGAILAFLAYIFEALLGANNSPVENSTQGSNDKPGTNTAPATYNDPVINNATETNNPTEANNVPGVNNNGN